MTPTTPPGLLRRRTFLRFAAVGGSAALGGLLAACSNGGAAPTAAPAPTGTPATIASASPTVPAAVTAGRTGASTPTTGSGTPTKEDTVRITRNSLPTTAGPREWFTGSVFIDTIATPAAPSRLGAASVHFAPGARTAWHTHPSGQTIWVTEGVGRCQRRGGPVEVIRPGDRVYFEPGEEHWHGADPDRFMTHIAMQEVDDSGSPVAWGQHVTDEEYGRQPG